MDLDQSMIRDIYDTHKVFMFGSFNCYQYKSEEFRKDVETVERKLFGTAVCPPALLPGDNDKKSIIFPSYLIRDNIFEIARYFCSVSDAVNRLSGRNALVPGQNVFCCVIPERIVSLYDHLAIYEHTFGNVVQWLKSKSMKVLGRKILKKEQSKAFKLANIVDKC